MTKTFQGSEATFTSILDSTDRLSNSESGNPRFMLWFTSHGPAKTMPDAAVNYAVENLNPGTRVDVWLNSRGQINHVEES